MIIHSTIRKSAFASTSHLKTIPLLLFAMWLAPAGGQTTLRYVPADAPVVLSVNLGNLDKKVNLAQLQQYDFYDAFIKDLGSPNASEADKAYFKTFMQTPEKLGFDLLEPFYFFLKMEGNTTYLTSVMKMGNRPLYEEGLQNLKLDDYPEKLSAKEGYLFWQHGDEAYAWNDEVVINTWGFRNPVQPSFETENSWETPDSDTGFQEEIIIEEPLEEMQEEYDSVLTSDVWYADREALERQHRISAWVDKVMNRQFLLPLSANEQFRSAAAQPSDVHFWMDYSYLSEVVQNRRVGVPGMGEALPVMQGMMAAFYADACLSVGLSFENGQMAMCTETFFNEDMAKLYRGMFDVRFNRKFLRYVQGGDQFFGYFYLNFNVRKTIEGYKSLLHKSLAAMPGYGQAASDALKVAGIFIDEKAIGKLMKGDIMLAVSGMQTLPVTTTIYDYDADFNVVPKDTTLVKTFPVFTAMATCGKVSDVMKFINLGLHSEVLKKEGNYYKISAPEMGGDLYLTLHRKLLIFTNNRFLVQQNLEKGIDSKRRLGKNHRQALRKNAMVFYWDIPNTIRAAAGSEADSNVGAAGYLNALGKEFRSFQVRQSKKVAGLSMKGEMNFDFVKKDVNALEQFFRFVNDIYLEFLGGAKI